MKPLRPALIALVVAGAAQAGQYPNADGSVSNGVVLEQGGKPVSSGNPLAGAGPKEVAVRAGRAFVVSTGTVTIAAGSFLNIRICNVSADQRITVTKRRFDNNAASTASPISYGGIGSPAAITSPSVNLMGTNLLVGGPASTALNLTAAVSTSRIDNAAGNAVPTGTGFLPVAGNVIKLEEWRVLPPGTCFANYIVGQAAGLGSIQAGYTLYAFTDPYP